jgi:hypothetical protein
MIGFLTSFAQIVFDKPCKMDRLKSELTAKIPLPF